MIHNEEKDMIRIMSFRIKEEKAKLVKEIAKLDSLSPLKTLTRGYSVIQNTESHVISSIKNLKTNDTIKIIMQDGSCDARVL